MDAGHIDTVELHARAIAEARRVVVGVRPEQLTGPTPCADWDVRALLNHMVGGNRLVAALVAGEPPPDRAADFVRDDPAAAFATTAERADSALRTEGVRQRLFRLPFGEVPGSAFAGMRFVDLLIHTWDLATATAQPTDLDPELCETALAMARVRMADAPRQPGGPIGPEVPVPADAPPCDRLAGYLGRRI